MSFFCPFPTMEATFPEMRSSFPKMRSTFPKMELQKSGTEEVVSTYIYQYIDTYPYKNVYSYIRIYKHYFNFTENILYKRNYFF